MLLQQLTRNVENILLKGPAVCGKSILTRVMATTGSDSNTRVAIAQMRSTNDKVGNLQQVKQLVEKAKNQHVKFLFLPECCDYVGENRQETLALSEPITGPTMGCYAELAKQNEMWLSLGGIHESILDETGTKTDKIYNAHVIIDSNGDIVNVYHKLHLFDVVTPEMRFRESDVVKKGNRIVPPMQSPIGNLGLQICYDVRFPEVAAKLRKLGADILTYPSAFAFSTGKAHWEILLRARAVENQCYVIAPAQIGLHNSKRQSYGHALIVDPWGKIVATTEERELDIATAEIDLEKIVTIRRNMPCFEHRRNDVYSLTAIEATELGRIDRRFGSQTIPEQTIFFESPHCFAFTNLRCVVKGHVLVSTKRVAPRLQDLNGDEVSDLFSTVCKVQLMLENIYQTSAATVTIQDGPDAGQTIEHVHFHVMPRRPGDFGHNDQIYVQLETLSTETKNREKCEMIAEATIYRNYFAKKQRSV